MARPKLQAVSMKKEGSMDRSTEQFIHDQNLLRYRKLLERVIDESQRQVLLNLLSDEVAKQAGGRLPKER
jgi:hypothetical protein